MNETLFLWPIIVLLGISVLLCILIFVFKIKIIPNFVLEIFAGMVLGLFLAQTDFHEYEALTNGLYVVGFSLIMFLSGYDANLDIITDDEHTSSHHINIMRVSIVLLLIVYVLSLIASLLFINNFEHKLLGVILLTITFSSTFAGVVAPLVNVEKLNRTGWGNLMITFAFLSELLSIVFLTIYMIFTDFDLSYLLYILFIVILFTALHFGLKIRRGSKMEEGMVFFKTRMIVLALAVSVFFSERAGGEYVLGAFLLGFFLKASGVSETRIEPIENIGFGLFIPLFFILLGTQIDLLYFINNPKTLLTVLALFVCFIVVKAPLLLLLKWYGKKTVFTSVVLASVTLVVAITANHIGQNLGIFSHEFGQSLILASTLTSLVSPIIFEINFPQTIDSIQLREKGITYGRYR